METKAGYVTIIGKPNVGKSTLMNTLIGERLSIITKKPQTTRKRVLGILNRDDYQIIFLDTPGILDPSYLLQEKMMNYVIRSIKDADIALLMIDIDEDPACEETLRNEKVKKVLSSKNVKKILLINKVDLVSQAKVKGAIAVLSEEFSSENIIPISALNNYNLDSLINMIVENLPPGPKLYPDDQLTDEPERFFVSEIIREKIFEFFRDEVPYSTEVFIEDFKERDKAKDYILASIIVERDSQKPIIIGKKGETLKKIGSIAREAIEQFLQRQVYLEIRVKVKSKWRSDPNLLKSFGYTSYDEK